MNANEFPDAEFPERNGDDRRKGAAGVATDARLSFLRAIACPETATWDARDAMVWGFGMMLFEMTRVRHRPGGPI